MFKTKFVDYITVFHLSKCAKIAPNHTFNRSGVFKHEIFAKDKLT